MLKRIWHKDEGFTMIEMMVVLIIIAVLIGVGLKFYTGYIENAKVTKAKAQISTMQAAMDSFWAQSADSLYPGTTLDLLNAGVKPYDDPDVATDAPNDDYLVGDALTVLDAKDPWGNPYVYVIPVTADGSANPASYEIRSGAAHDVQDNPNFRVVGGGSDGVSDTPIVDARPTAGGGD